MRVYVIIDNIYERGKPLIVTTTIRAALKYIADEMETAQYQNWGLWDISAKKNQQVIWGAEAGRELNRILAIDGAEGHATVDLFDVGRLEGISIKEARLFTTLYPESGDETNSAACQMTEATYVLCDAHIKNIYRQIQEEN